MMVAEYVLPDPEGDAALAHAYGFYQTDDGWFRRTSRDGRVQAVIAPDGEDWCFMTAEPDGGTLSTDRRRANLEQTLTNARRWLGFYNVEHRPQIGFKAR